MMPADWLMDIVSPNPLPRHHVPAVTGFVHAAHGLPTPPCPPPFSLRSHLGQVNRGKGWAGAQAQQSRMK